MHDTQADSTSSASLQIRAIYNGVSVGPAAARASDSSRGIDKRSKILIVGGGGTMGSSTALALARRGYTDIRILDVYSAPSNNSAGNDLNKVNT
jgi:FlaA1/EpsC-like NDP-sugar epimerase